MKENSVKTLLRQKKPVVGTWITLCPHPRIAKLFAATGFDFVLIDMEHTDFTTETVGALVLCARESGLVPIVRPPGTDRPHDLTRPLDAGAMGLLLPLIETGDQLREIMVHTKYHPDGKRILNLRGPHTEYGTGSVTDTIRSVNEQTLTIAMIESQKGLDNLEDICSVPGLDVIIIGPDDLSQDLGVPGQLDHPLVETAREQVVETCVRLGVACGFSCHSTEMASKWIERGVTFIPYSNDAAMVFNAAKEMAPKLKSLGGR